MAQPVSSEVGGSAPPSSAAAVLLRLTWMLFGNGLLVILAVRITQEAASSPIDWIYWAVAVGVVAARYVDISRFGGQTADGEPATLSDWRRWSAIFLGLAVGGYAAAIALGRGFTS